MNTAADTITTEWDTVRMADALDIIARRGGDNYCQHFTDGPRTCRTDGGRNRRSASVVNGWCDSCLAAAALGLGQEVGA